MRRGANEFAASELKLMRWVEEEAVRIQKVCVPKGTSTAFNEPNII